MKIREQIEALRAVSHYDTKKMYDNTELGFLAADTMEAMLEVVEAAKDYLDADGSISQIWLEDCLAKLEGKL